MSDNTPWWFGLTQEEIDAELAEENSSLHPTRSADQRHLRQLSGIAR